MNNRSFSVMSVDHERNRHRSRSPTIKLDLAEVAQCQVLLDFLINCDKFLIFWAAVPCGTCSKARSIPLSAHFHGPRPLRSESHPRGLGNLTEAEQLRVDKANLIYDHVYVCACQVLSKNGLVIIENPRNSILWHLDNYVHLSSFPACSLVTFNTANGLQTNLHGLSGQRFSQIALLCRN